MSTIDKLYYKTKKEYLESLGYKKYLNIIENIKYSKISVIIYILNL